MDKKDPNINFPPPPLTPMDNLPKTNPSPRFMSKRLALIFLGIMALIFAVGIFMTIRDFGENEKTEVNTVLPTPTPDPTADWQTANVGIYTFRYPSDWEQKQPGDGGGFLVGPIGKDTISVIADQYIRIDATPEEIASGSTRIEPALSTKAITIDNHNAVLQELRNDNIGITINAYIGDVEAQSQKGSLIVVAAISNSEDAESYKGIFNQILATFKFIDQTSPLPSATPGGEQVACTQEAKLCPDGSYVGREGPNCDFAPCP